MGNQVASKRNNPGSVRSIRSLGIFGGAAIAVSIGVSLGVYDLLGLLINEFGRGLAPFAYLLMIVIALPIVLTYAERAAFIPGANGAYALARNSQWLVFTYFSGWLLMSGYVALIALLAWGAAVHLGLGLELFDLDVPTWLLPLAVIVALVAGNALGFTRTWHRRARAVTIAVVLVLILIARGFFAQSTIPEPVPFFSTQQGSILQMTLLVSSSLWGVILLLGVRNEITLRARSMRASMLVGVIVSGLLGALAAYVISRYVGTISPRYAPLLTFARAAGFFPSSLLDILYIAFGFAINFFAMDRVLIDSLHLFEGMINDGFLPARAQHLRSEGGALGWPLLFVTLCAGLLVTYIAPLMLTGLIAATFFWSTALIHLPDLFDNEKSLLVRRTKLPFHPLVPALTIAISILFPLVNLDRTQSWTTWTWLWVMVVWIGVGLFFYLSYARTRGLAARASQSVIEEEPFDSYLDEVRDAILVAITDTRSAPGLIEAGLRIARGRNCTLFVLRVLQVPEQTANDRKQQLARRTMESLDAMIAEAQADVSVEDVHASDDADDHVQDPSAMLAADVPARALVRIGLDPLTGIVEAASAPSVDLLLVHWSGQLDLNEPIADLRINRLMREAECDIAVLSGKLPPTLDKVVVSVAGGPHARCAVDMAESLIDPAAGANLRLVYVLTPASEQDDRIAAMQMIEVALAELESTAGVEYEQVSAPTVQAGLLAETADADLLLIGAYRDFFFRRAQFRGVATHVAAQSSTPTLIMRAYEPTRYLLLARVWEFISDPLPALTSERRAVVNDLMRTAAKSSIDFYMLIILSAMIASLGLLQNSPAVIIGAMLVAPLMSPILAMGMGMANGDPETLTGGAEVTAKGVALAVFVGAVVAMLSPFHSPTHEILARTSPNLLDLMVALASGAAAGYAVSRSEVAAALPGVAIAAALVPPLCVVGYGLGTAQLTYATGATLLFTTNLVAIIFSAAIVFVALGFHPRRSDMAKVGRGVRLTIISLLVITAVLVASTIITVRDLNREVAVKQIFNQPIIANKVSVQTLEISKDSGVYTIETTAIALHEDGLSTDEIAYLEAELQRVLGGTVRLKATVLTGERMSSTGYANRQQADSLFVDGVEARGGRVLEQSSVGGQISVVIEATVVASAAGGLDDTALATIQQEIAEGIGMPATLRITVLTGEYKELSPVEN